MKKLVVIVPVLILCLLLASCGKENKLIGTWIPSESGWSTLTFKKDGTLIVQDNGNSSTMKWETDGDTLIVFDQNGRTETRTYKVTDSRLIIYDENGWSVESTFSRK